jgi:putative oxidoreductase
LILRFATGLSLVAVAHVTGDPVHTASLLARWTMTAVAVLIWIGLWTPLAALIGAVIQISAVIIWHRFDLSLLVFSAVALSLAMLGPGAWSFDARLFGRKRII